MAGKRDFCALHNVETNCGTDTSLLQWVQQVAVCKDYSSLGVRLSVHLHLVPRLRQSGTIPPLHPYVFVVCTRTTVPNVSRLMNVAFHNLSY